MAVGRVERVTFARSEQRGPLRVDQMGTDSETIAAAECEHGSCDGMAYVPMRQAQPAEIQRLISRHFRTCAGGQDDAEHRR
jgi:hypothetical protein